MSSELLKNIPEGSEAFLDVLRYFEPSGALSFVRSGSESFLKVLRGLLTF